MADHHEALSDRYILDFTNTLDGGKAAVITDTVTQCGLYLYSDRDSLAFSMVNQQAERIAELESAHAIAIEIGAQYAAERDQLRAEVETLKVALRMGAAAEVARAHKVVGLRAEVERLMSDAERIDYLEYEINELRTRETGEDDYEWVVRSNHMDQPYERDVGRGKTIRAAIDHARTTHKDEG